MQEAGLAKQIARWTALGALFAIPLAPLIVANSFFFPFITGKAFYFRILAEVAVAAWAALAFMDRAYRPRVSWIGAAVLAFVAWMFVADAFAINATKAFWSNFERMEGWVLLIHLLGFFFAASNVLRVEKKWRAWFLASLAVSLVVVVYALLQLSGALPIHQGSYRIDASLGNSAYLAIYLLFNTFIAGWLALTEKRPWLAWSLVALAALEGALIFFTETRGAVLGLTGGLLIAGVLTLLTAGKRVRYLAAWGVMIILLLAGSFYLARGSSFVQGNHVLQRIASISLADGQVRFTIWGMALAGVGESPKTLALGWGQEGFNYIFNKYYDPSLYRQEPWFDRAHNAFLDWLTAGGVPAFLMYLALWGSVLWYLWRRSELSHPERIALTAALAGYAVHNLFVFDNLYSYIYFFALMALVDSQVARPLPALERAPELSAVDGLSYALPAAGASALALVFLVNVPGMRVAQGLITALSQGDPVAELAGFRDLAAHPAFAAQEVREQLVGFAGAVSQDQQAGAVAREAEALAVSEMRKQIAAYPLDAREHLQLAAAYRIQGDAQKSLDEIFTALKLSPAKEAIWVEAGAAEWNLGNTAAAAADFAAAYDLGRQFPELASYAAAGKYGAGDAKSGDALLEQAYGTTTVDADILSVAYYRTEDWPRFIRLFELRAEAPGASLDTLFALATGYYAAGARTRAIQFLQQVETVHPEASSLIDAAIAQIQSGR